jgi:hypothetical protein
MLVLEADQGEKCVTLYLTMTGGDSEKPATVYILAAAYRSGTVYILAGAHRSGT